MNHVGAKKRSYTENFSDATLCLLGHAGRASLKCHKIILAREIPYFENLFLFPGNENKNEFTIHVDDPELTKLFLLTFYGDRVSENWTPRQLLQVIKLRSFFCLDLCPQDLYDLTISPEDFPFLLEVISLPEMPGVESDFKLRRMIKRNTPLYYDWQGVDENFKKLMTRPMNFEMVSFDEDQTLRKWNIATGECSLVHSGLKKDPRTIAAVLADQKTMIMTSDWGTLQKRDIATGECLQVYKGHDYWVNLVVILIDPEQDPEQASMISASDDETLRWWNIKTGECLQVYKGHTNSVISVAILADPEQPMMISAANDKTLRLWDIKTGECLQVYKGHRHSVRSVAILALVSDPQRPMMISASYDRTLRLWDIKTGECLRVYEGHTDFVTSVAILDDPEQAMMISASFDQTLRLWDIKTGECLRVYRGHADRVISVVVLTGSTTMISASKDGTLRKWDIASGECSHVYLGHTNEVYSVVLLTD